MAKKGLKQLKGFVDAHDGKHPVVLFEQPTQAEPDAPPKKNYKDDLVYRGVGRVEWFLTTQVMALGNSLRDRYGLFDRITPQTVPELSAEQRKWAEKIIDEVFEPQASLKLRAAVAGDAIAMRKALLDQKGYQKPEDPKLVADDCFEQLTAAIGLALAPLLNELDQTRLERDLARLAREELVMRAFPARHDNQRQPEATDPDDVRTNVFTPPRPLAQPPNAESPPVTSAVAAPVDRATKPVIDQPRPPLTTSPDSVRTAAVGTVANDKPSSSQRTHQPGDSDADKSPTETSAQRSDA